MDVRALLNANDNRLRALYGGEVPAARYEALADAFRAHFSREMEAFVSAPGRTEVIGNHTDHNLGRVLAAAVNLDTVAAVAPAAGSVVTLWSAGYDRPFVVDLADLSVHEEEKETTYALIRGVAARLKALGYKIGGFDACVTSTVFKGSGLSSSAAFEVMLVAVFDALFNGWVVNAKLRAQISQYAENVYFGKPSGLMDQMASSVGGLVTIDFLPDDPDVRAIQYDFQKKGYAACVVTVGGDHGDLTGEYAGITTEMRAVCEALGVRALALTDADRLTAALPEMKNRVPDRAILRAFHFVDETARVQDAVAALERDDIGGFLDDLVASGESSWKLLQNLYVPGSDNQEMPLALEMSRRMLAGRGAWRIHGGGFAGTILAFVPLDTLEAYRAQMDAVFGKGATVPLSIRPEGAVVIR
ncbi:MAG TPA: galactokinase [Candidatus Pullichristensenella avicola]|nr:galactokinase [Candidatus Pullichristensenella avicola]